MKITKVDVLQVQTQLKNGHWRPTVCRIYTDEGIYGDGEAALAYGEAQDSAFGIVQNFARLIIGMNPLEHEIIWDKLYRSTFWGQNGGPVIFAGISAIDIALWDIRGKYYNAPVHELLGGKRRPKLRTYASQLQFGWGPDIIPQRTPEDYAREAKRAVDDGYDCIKIDFFTFRPEGGSYTDTDRLGLLNKEYLDMYEARLKAVRQAIGPKVDIIIENHSFTDAQSSSQIGRMAKKYGIIPRKAIQSHCGNEGADLLPGRVLTHQADVLLHRAPGEQPGALEHIAQPALRALHRALVRSGQPGDDIQQGGLAAAGRADECHDLPLRQRKRQVGKDRQAVKGLADPREFQHTGAPFRQQISRSSFWVRKHPTTSTNDQAMMASGWTLSRAEVMAPPMPLFVVSTSPITASFHPPPMTISRAELK